MGLCTQPLLMLAYDTDKLEDMSCCTAYVRISRRPTFMAEVWDVKSNADVCEFIGKRLAAGEEM